MSAGGGVVRILGADDRVLFGSLGLCSGRRAGETTLPYHLSNKGTSRGEGYPPTALPLNILNNLRFSMSTSIDLYDDTSTMAHASHTVWLEV